MDEVVKRVVGAMTGDLPTWYGVVGSLMTYLTIAGWLGLGEPAGALPLLGAMLQHLWVPTGWLTTLTAWLTGHAALVLGAGWTMFLGGLLAMKPSRATRATGTALWGVVLLGAAGVPGWAVVLVIAARIVAGQLLIKAGKLVGEDHATENALTGLIVGVLAPAGILVHGD